MTQTQHIIWYANQPYVCGAGLDGDIYDTQECAQEMLWMTARDGAGCVVLPYIECAEGQIPPDPVPPGSYQAGFYQTDDGQIFHVNGRDMDQKTMDALQAMVKAAVKMVDRGEFPPDDPTTQDRIADTFAEARRQGWRIEDLNANDQGWTVRGPSWKVTPPNGEKPLWFWNEKLAATHIAARLSADDDHV